MPIIREGGGSGPRGITSPGSSDVAGKIETGSVSNGNSYDFEWRVRGQPSPAAVEKQHVVEGDDPNELLTVVTNNGPTSWVHEQTGLALLHDVGETSDNLAGPVHLFKHPQKPGMGDLARLPVVPWRKLLDLERDV
jgi:hypothetical protein